MNGRNSPLKKGVPQPEKTWNRHWDVTEPPGHTRKITRTLDWSQKGSHQQSHVTTMKSLQAIGGPADRQRAYEWQIIKETDVQQEAEKVSVCLSIPSQVIDSAGQGQTSA